MVSPRSGSYKRHSIGVNNGLGDDSYESFCPVPLPPNPPLELSSRMVALLVRATGCIRELDVRAQLTPNVEPFIDMLALKEALMSSQIEGIAVTLRALGSAARGKLQSCCARCGE